MSLSHLIAVARGSAPADLILADAQIVNTFSGEIQRGNVAVCGEQIAGVGDYQAARQTIDLQGHYVVPGLINGHIHTESSLLHIARYAEAVVPRGVTAIVTDLHEIANVLGRAGIQDVLDTARSLPLDMYFMAPSCVPATHLETAGARLGPDDIRQLLAEDTTTGLGELMNYPGVLCADSEVLAKVGAAGGKVIDGHAPGLHGKDLNAYLAAGIRSDHESITLDEAREKLQKGMYVMIREGSSEKNLAQLLPLVTDRTYKRCLFVVDDRSCADLLRDGDIDAVVRQAIGLGLDPVRAVQLATLNAAECFGLRGVGGIAPGYTANIAVLSDLHQFAVDLVIHRGRVVARQGRALVTPHLPDNRAITHSMKVQPFGVQRLALRADAWRFPVIQIVPHQIVTRSVDIPPTVADALVVADPARDVLKLVVVERHKATGNIGIGLVQGFQLQRGALASSVAHDSHNIIAVGVDDRDLYVAIQEVIRLGGGLVAAADGQTLCSLALPIAGLVSTQPLAEVVAQLDAVERAAQQLGCRLPAPFATLSFLALPVIPELRLTDKGLVDVRQFKLLGDFAG